MQETEAQRRLQEHGVNRLVLTAKTWLEKESLLKLIMYLLRVNRSGCNIYDCLGEIADAFIIIIVVVVINTVVGVVQESKAECSRGTQNMSTPKAVVKT